MHGFNSCLAARHVRVNVFDHDDCVIDYQTDRRRDSSQGHEIETESRKIHGEKGDQDGHGNYDNRDKGRAPVAQKSIKNSDGKQQTDND